MLPPTFIRTGLSGYGQGGTGRVCGSQNKKICQNLTKGCHNQAKIKQSKCHYRPENFAKMLSTLIKKLLAFGIVYFFLHISDYSYMKGLLNHYFSALSSLGGKTAQFKEMEV